MFPLGLFHLPGPKFSRLYFNFFPLICRWLNEILRGIRVCVQHFANTRASCSASLIFVIPKEQDQNTSLHAWELLQWALSCVWVCWPPLPSPWWHFAAGLERAMGLGICSCTNSRDRQLCILMVRAREFPALLQPVLGQTPSFSAPSALLGLWSDVAVPWLCFPINHRHAAEFWVGVWLWEFTQTLLRTREALLLPLLCCSVAGFKIYIVAGIGIHICSQHMLLAQYQQMLLSSIKSRGAALLWSVTLWNGTVGFLLGVSVTYMWSSFSLRKWKMLVVCF